MDMAETLARLPEALHAPLCVEQKQQRYLAGEVLFHEGDSSDGLYMVLRGRVKVYATNAGGRVIVYNTLGPGEILGELSLDGGRRSASVKAVTDVECTVMTNRAARELMRLRPEFADQILTNLITRVRQATHMTRSIALDGVPERVIALLESAALGKV